MSDADCTPGREPRSVTASFLSLAPFQTIIYINVPGDHPPGRPSGVPAFGGGMFVTRNHVLDGGQHPPCEGEILRGNRAARCKI